METDLLIDDLMATSSDTRYRAVGSNGLLSDNTSSTDDEMLDVTTTAPVDYSDLTDRSQGKNAIIPLYFTVPTSTGKPRKPGKWEYIFQSGKSQEILNKLERSGNFTQNTEKKQIFPKISKKREF